VKNRTCIRPGYIDIFLNLKKETSSLPLFLSLSHTQVFPMGNAEGIEPWLFISRFTCGIKSLQNGNDFF
jgi:hypothetical protein